MDCCKYGEWRARAAGWECAPYALPYAPYAHYYAPQAHDPYRYYRYDYPQHHVHSDHVMPMDYGAYSSKESRVRRTVARRDARAHTPAPQLPLPPTPPLDGRATGYCEPQMWPHYQMGVMNGGWGGGVAGWSRGSCARETLRYAADCRPQVKHMHSQNTLAAQDGRITPYPLFEDSYAENGAKSRGTPDYPAHDSRVAHERFFPEPRQTPPQEKRPPVVPLPAFQQAFGSTEIGKFAEAFSRAEVALEENDNFYESFPDWEGPEAQWTSPAAREIKCEDNY